MSVYSVDGESLQNVYEVSGESLSQAYNINGDPMLGPSIFVVMEFNIQWWEGINANTSIMNSIFSAYTPHICGIQETGQSGTLKYIGTQFQEGKAMTGLVNNPAFLFNVPYSDYGQGVYTSQGNETRGWQKCNVVIDGKTVAVYNTHLENDIRSARIAQAMEMLDMLKNEEYFICIGDFNFGGTSYSSEQYIAIAEPFIEEGFNLANWTTDTGIVNTWFNGTTVDGSTQKYATDNIITSSNILINDVVYDQRKIEAETGLVIDHIPTVVWLTIT